MHYRAFMNRTPVYDRHDVMPPFEVVSFSYEADGPDQNRARPVFFLFNGGPGSSTIWLHMTAFGPEKVSVDLEASTESQYHLSQKANPGFLIDIGDLVFVDPVQTGLTRPMDDAPSKKFQDIRVDARSMCRFAETWLAANDRNDAPVYLVGSSYGSLRIAGMASHNSCWDLRKQLQGLVFLSGFLDLRARAPRSPFRVMGSFPSWASLAWTKDDQLRSEWNADWVAFLEAARSIALEEIGPALMEDLANLAEKPHTREANVMAFLGLSDIVNIGPSMQVTELEIVKHLRDGTRLCPYDTRFSCERGAYLPSQGLNALGATLEAKLAAYLARQMDYTLDVDSYIVAADRMFRVNWNFSFMKSMDGGTGTNMAEVLKTSFRGIARMRTRNGQTPTAPRIMVASGAYDIITPFFAMELALVRAGFRKDDLTIHTYDGGHMMYLDEETGRQLAADIRSFVLGEEASDL